MLVLKPIISILLQHKFNIGRMRQVGTVRHLSAGVLYIYVVAVGTIALTCR